MEKNFHVNERKKISHKSFIFHSTKIHLAYIYIHFHVKIHLLKYVSEMTFD